MHICGIVDGLTPPVLSCIQLFACSHAANQRKRRGLNSSWCVNICHTRSQDVLQRNLLLRFLIVATRRYFSYEKTHEMRISAFAKTIYLPLQCREFVDWHSSCISLLTAKPLKIKSHGNNCDLLLRRVHIEDKHSDIHAHTWEFIHVCFRSRLSWAPAFIRLSAEFTPSSKGTWKK